MQRRKARRYDARVEGFYELFTPGSQMQPTATTNVGAQGLTLVTGARTELAGARLRVHLTLPSGERVQLLGAIVWVRPPVHSSAATLILPGTVGVRLAHGEQPAAYRAFLDECAARALEEPPLPDDARAFIAAARSEQAAGRGTEPKFPRAMTAAERLRRGLAPLAQPRKSQPPGEGRSTQPPPARPSQPPPRPSQPPPRPSQPPPRPSQPPPSGHRSESPGDGPRRTRPPIGIDSSLGLLPDPPSRPRSEDQITDEELTHVLKEFLVTRSDRLARQPTPEPTPAKDANLDALLKAFVDEVRVPDRPTLPEDDLDAILRAMLSETTWWRRGLKQRR